MRSTPAKNERASKEKTSPVVERLKKKTRELIKDDSPFDLDESRRARGADGASRIGLLAAPGARAVPELIEDLRSEDRQAQMLAAQHLKDIGLAAAPAVPLLIELATSGERSSLQSEAAGALPAIDLSAARRVMAYQLPKLQDSDPQNRRDAAAVLGALGPAAKPAVLSLVGVLNDPNTVVRDRAVRALGSIGLQSETVMNGLLHALRDPEWTVRYAAVMQFSFNGFSSPESHAVLQDLTTDSNQTVAHLAQSAVAAAERPIQSATYRFMLKQGTNRIYTLLQLAKLGPRAAETAPDIAGILTSDQPLERYLAACALAEMGPAAKEIVSAVRAAAQDADPVVREAAAEALYAIENDHR